MTNTAFKPLNIEDFVALRESSGLSRLNQRQLAFLLYVTTWDAELATELINNSLERTAEATQDLDEAILSLLDGGF